MRETMDFFPAVTIPAATLRSAGYRYDRKLVRIRRALVTAITESGTWRDREISFEYEDNDAHVAAVIVKCHSTGAWARVTLDERYAIVADYQFTQPVEKAGSKTCDLPELLQMCR